MINSNNGTDPTAVYKNKAVLDKTRSDWYPQPIIIIKIGTRLSSNEKNNIKNDPAKKNFAQQIPINPSMNLSVPLSLCDIVGRATKHA